MDPVRIVLLKLILAKFEIWKWEGQALPEKKVGKPRAMRPSRFRHISAHVKPSLLDILFLLFQVKRGTTFQFTVVCFDFYLISNIFSCRCACMYNSRIKLLTLISPINIWCYTWKIWLWKDWIEWHNWQTSQATITSRPVTSLGHQGRRIIFWRKPTFCIDSM